MHATDDTATLVALLARAGAARDRLREGVTSAGGHIVLEEDPNELDVAALDAAAPQVVLVALEPAVEDALERLEPVLETPRYSLMFEEAELAARREGWEAQRWIRHLAAKLQGHGNVLPPGHENDAEPASVLQPGLPPRPADQHVDAPLQFHLDEAQVQAEAVPGDTLYAISDVAEPQPEVRTFEELMAATPSLPPEPEAGSLAPAASLPPPLPAVDEVVRATPVVDHGDFASWSLVEDDAYVDATPVVEATPEVPPALASLLNSDFSLVELEAAGDGGARQAVLLVAGIGGPDAVRRVLAGLPEEFDRPVLVQLRLDGGRYANLVKQMARATSLPVSLADPGQPLQHGNVYILPEGVGLEAGGAGLVFSTETAELLQALQPQGSAVLLLSGADVALVEPTLAFAANGGWVAGQVGEGCYDPAAASQLAVAGMAAGDPEYLVAELAVYCSN